MDYLAGGELFTHLQYKVLLRETEVRLYAAEILLALEHLHNLNIVHRCVGGFGREGSPSLLICSVHMHVRMRVGCDWVAVVDVVMTAMLAQGPQAGERAVGRVRTRALDGLRPVKGPLRGGCHPDGVRHE